MFYKLYSLLGWFAKQELSQGNNLLGCHHLETGRSSKTFFFWYIFISIYYFELLNGLWKPFTCLPKILRELWHQENLTFLKDGVGQGLIPVVDFSSKCHLGAHAVAKSFFMPHFLLFNHPISNTSAQSPTSACFTHLSPIFQRKYGSGLLRDYVWMLVFNQTKKKKWSGVT